MTTTKKKTLYADLPSQITLRSGVVRSTFAVMGEPSPAGEQRKPEVEEELTLVIPLEGFIRFYQVADQMVKRLEKEGVLKQRDKEKSFGVHSPVDPDLIQ